VKVQPDFEDAAFRLGFLQLQRGEYAGSVDSFEICVKRRPDWIEALLNLGLACWKFEDLETANATFERVLALQPLNPDALRALVTIAIERKDHQRAWTLYLRLSDAGDTSHAIPFNLGLLLQQAGEHEQSAQCYRAVAELAPDFSPALLNLGHALKAMGKDDEARQAWGRAIEADPALAGGYFK
jgi:tetratricopeptide (TPR) repeat protein